MPATTLCDWSRPTRTTHIGNVCGRMTFLKSNKTEEAISTNNLFTVGLLSFCR